MFKQLTHLGKAGLRTTLGWSPAGFLQCAFETKTRLCLNRNVLSKVGIQPLYFLPHQDHPAYPIDEVGS